GARPVSCLASAAKGVPPLAASVALKRFALSNSLISRASGFAVENGSALSISILISRPDWRSRTGTDRIWVSLLASSTKGAAGPSKSAPSPSRADMDIDLVGADVDAFHQTGE